MNVRALLLLLVLATPLSAQYPEYQPADLSPADSVELYRLTMLAADSAGQIQQDQVLYLREVETEWSFTPRMSQRIFDELSATFPNLRPFVDDEFFECPPGVRAAFPGQACPTKDDGFAVRFSRVSVGGDSDVEVVISIMTGGQLSGWLAKFDRSQDGWALRDFRLNSIT